MLKRSVKRVFARIVLPCLFFSACASAGRNLTKETSVESQKSLAAGDYEKALDGFKEAHGKNPRNKELTANYMRTVEDIKRTADGARGRQDYARAEGIYRILLDRFGDFEGFAAKLTFGKAELGTALKECRIAAVDNTAARAMKAANFAKAIEIFRAALKENPADAELAAKYGATVREIKTNGDKAFAAKNFSRAGSVNTLLLRSYPSFERLKPPVAFTRDSLREAVSACRESLTKTGLEEYRNGELAKAIATWESLLAFDPDNAEIKKAVTTARTQLDAIKKKK
jgi:tetratricopeptide (TPR) repeat protein